MQNNEKGEVNNFGRQENMYVEDDFDAYIRHGESGQISVPNFTNLGEISGPHQYTEPSRSQAPNKVTNRSSPKRKDPRSLPAPSTTILGLETGLRESSSVAERGSDLPIVLDQDPGPGESSNITEKGSDDASIVPVREKQACKSPTHLQGYICYFASIKDPSSKATSLLPKASLGLSLIHI